MTLDYIEAVFKIVTIMQIHLTRMHQHDTHIEIIEKFHDNDGQTGCDKMTWVFFFVPNCVILNCF